MRSKKLSRIRFNVMLSTVLHTIGCGMLLAILAAEGQRLAGDFRLALAIGIVFWAANVLGIVVQLSTHALRKAVEKKSGYKVSGLPGVLSFCKTPFGKIADISLAIGIVLVVISQIFAPTGTFALIAIVLSMVFFCWHCYFNGKCYRIYVELTK